MRDKYAVTTIHRRARRNSVSSVSGMGGQLALKVSGVDTQGAFAVFEAPTLPDAGPPLHLHQIENEWFYVLAGEHDFQVGDQHFRLAPGGSAYAPRLIPHTWLNIWTSAGRIVSIAQPAGQLEAFMIEFSQWLSRRESDRARLATLFEKYAMTVVGPSLSR